MKKQNSKRPNIDVSYICTVNRRLYNKHTTVKLSIKINISLQRWTPVLLNVYMLRCQQKSLKEEQRTGAV